MSNEEMDIPAETEEEKKDRKTFTFYSDPDDIVFIKKTAKDNDLNKSQVMRKIIREYRARNEGQTA